MAYNVNKREINKTVGGPAPPEIYRNNDNFSGTEGGIDTAEYIIDEYSCKEDEEVTSLHTAPSIICAEKPNIGTKRKKDDEDDNLRRIRILEMEKEI